MPRAQQRAAAGGDKDASLGGDGGCLAITFYQAFRHFGHHGISVDEVKRMLNAEILSPTKGLANVWWSYDVALSALVQKFGRGNFTFERIKATGRRFPILAALRNDAVLVVAGKLNCPCYVYEGWFYTHLDPKAVDEDKDGHGEKKRRDDAMKRTGDDLHCVPIIGGELYDLDLPVDEVESNNTVTPPLQRHLCAKEILQINEDGSFRRGKPHRGNECGDIIEP